MTLFSLIRQPRRLVLLLAAMVFGAGSGFAGPLLYAIRGNGFGQPQTLVAIDAPNGPVADVRNLGDGSLFYGGGLAWDTGAGKFYTFENDSNGLLSLVSFTTATGPAVAIASFAYGVGGGLIHAGSGLFGIVNDGLGDSALLEFKLSNGTAAMLFTLGQGFLGGIAWNPMNAMMYAIQNDSFGASTLVEIDLVNQTTNTVKALGYGFYGGLVIDPLTGIFWAVGTDSFGAGTLYDISSNDSPIPYAATGDGFLFASLSLGAADGSGGGGGGAEVPEPASLWLAGCGVLGLMVFKRK